MHKKTMIKLDVARTCDGEDLYSSQEEMSRLMASGLSWARSYMSVNGMISAVDAASIVGMSVESLIRAAEAGEAIGIRTEGGDFKFPIWQFNSPFRTVIKSVGRVLYPTNGWALLNFFVSSHPALDGASPKSALETGVSIERVLNLAIARAHE